MVSLFLLLFCSSCSSQTLPAEKILSVLLSHDELNLINIENCSVVPSVLEEKSKYRSISGDFSYYLSLMDRGTNLVSASCEEVSKSANFCTVSLNHELGELVWNRVYRFYLKSDNISDLSELECFTLP
jgi:hypothetical protein